MIVEVVDGDRPEGVDADVERHPRYLDATIDKRREERRGEVEPGGRGGGRTGEPGKHRLVAREVVCPGIATADVAGERHASHLAEELLRGAAAVGTGKPGATGAPSGHLESEPIGSVCIHQHDALADRHPSAGVGEESPVAVYQRLEPQPLPTPSRLLAAPLEPSRHDARVIDDEEITGVEEIDEIADVTVGERAVGATDDEHPRGAAVGERLLSNQLAGEVVGVVVSVRHPKHGMPEASAGGMPRPGTVVQPRVHVRPAAEPRSPAMSSTIHTSVLPAESLSFLDLKPGDRVVDGTLGGGGHTRLLAEAVGPTGLVIAIDRDPGAIARGVDLLAGLPVRFAQANYRDLPEVLDALSIDKVDAVLLDVGLSSDRLADIERGFSFDADGPLDLRFDPTEGEPAWRLVNRLRPESLADLIYEYGEERHSRRIARRIAAVREKEPIRTARQFARIVTSAIPRQYPPARIHPATRTFQALRIAVNEELKSLQIALERTPTRLVRGGRMVVIAFHSLEDRLVKQAFRNTQVWECLTRSPVDASEEEVARNPRSRSARLRAARRLPDPLDPASKG